MDPGPLHDQVTGQDVTHPCSSPDRSAVGAVGSSITCRTSTSRMHGPAMTELKSWISRPGPARGCVVPPRARAGRQRAAGCCSPATSSTLRTTTWSGSTWAADRGRSWCHTPALGWLPRHRTGGHQLLIAAIVAICTPAPAMCQVGAIRPGSDLGRPRWSRLARSILSALASVCRGSVHRAQGSPSRGA